MRVGAAGEILSQKKNAGVRPRGGGGGGGKFKQKKIWGWWGGGGGRRGGGAPLPIATMAEPCGVRAIAAQLLDVAGVSWTEVFVGGGVPAVAAAVMAGLGVAA